MTRLHYHILAGIFLCAVSLFAFCWYVKKKDERLEKAAMDYYNAHIKGTREDSINRAQLKMELDSIDSIRKSNGR